MRWLWWRVKKFCDRRLYGEVILPPQTCPGCGKVRQGGEELVGHFHQACAPKE